MIVKTKNGFAVKTADGSRTLGTHKTHESAQKQLAAIEISKQKRNKY